MKTAISFDEWWEENYMVVSADRTEAEDIYNLGQQSQQAKIDELQARITELEETICTHLDERFLKGNKDEK